MRRFVVGFGLVLSWTAFLLFVPAQAHAEIDVNSRLSNPQKTDITVKTRKNTRRPSSTVGESNGAPDADPKSSRGGGSSLPAVRYSGEAENSPIAQAKKDERRIRQYVARAERVKAEIDRETTAYESSLSEYNSCMSKGVSFACSAPTKPNLPKLPTPTMREIPTMQLVAGAPVGPNRATGDPPTQPQVVLDPVTVAYMAVANLTLTAPTPGIGPSPDLNKWKMAAVGYPLWLWAEGNTDPPPVSDSVYTLSVSLDARVTKIDFLMGDGHKVTCESLGTKWTPGTPAGQESPTCGYRYQKPSLPKGKYTVTARTHWAIDWSINGQTGTIPYVQAATTQLPVGELQVLVR